MLNNVVFCFTGKAPMARAKMETLAIKAGASVTKSITNKTTILVIADPNSKSTKAKKARSMGLKIIDPYEFCGMCDDNIKTQFEETLNQTSQKFLNELSLTEKQYTKSKTKPLKKKKKHSFTRRIEL